MRCDCCNKRLNDYEATLKSISTGEYMNTCKSCLNGLDIETVGRNELSPQDIVEDEFGDDMYDNAPADEFLSTHVFREIDND